MKKVNSNVAYAGMDVHYKFSNVTFRDASGKWRAIFDRVTNAGRKNHNRGYIKVARELVKVVYAVWAKGVDYQVIPPVRPGRKSNKKKSRSETGQLYHPMVHALPA